MNPVFNKLASVLEYERKRECNDTAVIGGLERFVNEWVAQVKDSSPAVQAHVQEIASELAGYHSQTPAKRLEAINRAIQIAREPVTHIEGSKQLHDKIGDPNSGNGKPARAAAPERKVRHKPQPQRSQPPPPPEPASDLEGDLEPEAEEEQPERPPTVAERSKFDFGLDAPVTRLRDVGDKYANKLARLGITTIRDLLYHFPHRYDDYRKLKKISELVYGEEATVIAKVLDVNTRQIRGRQTITTVLLGDQSGTVKITFFNQPFLSRSLRHGADIVISGRVDNTGSRLSFSHPSWEPLSKELLHTGRMVPVYPTTEGISNRWIRKQLRDVVRFFADKVPDALPTDLRHDLGLMDLTTALREIHFPTSEERNNAARRRLAFEEFLIIQIGVLKQRQDWKRESGRALTLDRQLLDQFLEALPFQLTRAQRKALDEILAEIQQPIPMSRLLQGDVGSGKTVVAAIALLMAVANGAQGVMMAPTEILAEQHHKTMSRLFDSLRERVPGFNVQVGLLVGSLKARDKAEQKRQIANGEIQIAVGTHALIQEDVQFKDLALAVIDEQHRFGVSQRAAIRQKGYNPHILVMSATPIPRTLALTVYGDLDLSIIDELPPGRQEIKTKWLVPNEREGAYSFIRKQVSAGRQAFVICPLIEESEAIDAKAAVEEYERLRTEVYADLRVGLVHGKLRPAEKDAVMSQFRDGALDILVATSVVEVGIDVPNATVMLIEGADRFGLAQLHQFRGRVGRGADKSYCLLLAEKRESAGDQRLQVIETTHNGFKLAEEDLKMRGPGEFFGTRQSGLPDLKVAKLSDVKLLELARASAQKMFEQDPGLDSPEHRVLAENVRHFWHGEGDLS